MEAPDFSHIKWGAFTQQFKRFHRDHPSVTSLEQFAHIILQHPEKFKPITKKRAEFYLNVIQHHHHHIAPF